MLEEVRVDVFAGRIENRQRYSHVGVADEALETCWFDEKIARGLVAKLTR
jgi:hypothetical protein